MEGLKLENPRKLGFESLISFLSRFDGHWLKRNLKINLCVQHAVNRRYELVILTHLLITAFKS